MKPASPVRTDDKTLYRPPGDPVLVEVPSFEFVMIDGSGDPGTSPDYQAAIVALYAVSYPVVITLKRAGRLDLKVRPLEGLWWADDLSVFQPVGADRVRIKRFDEGLCAQLMHRGPYADEGPDIVRLHDFAAAQGFRLSGHHHEIYLTDPRKCAPEKMRTVLRHPVGR